MKRIAMINIAVPPDTRPYWEGVVRGFGIKADWCEPLNREKGKTSIHCAVNTRDSKYEAFTAFLNKHGLRYPAYNDTPEYEKQFKAVLHSNGVTWSIYRIEHIYTDAELREFPLLRLSCNRSPADGDYPGRGTEYDFSAGCPHCGRGARQTSPLMVTKEGLSGRALITHTVAGEILLGEPLVEAWKAAEVTGVKFRQVLHYRTGAPLPYWQVIATHEMPEMTRESKFLKGEPKPGSGCPACRRGDCTRSIFEPWEYAYSSGRVKAEDLPDVVRTWECFGESSRKGIPTENETQSIAQPDILVKPKVFDLFRRLMIRQTCFEPVRIVDCPVP